MAHKKKPQKTRKLDIDDLIEEAAIAAGQKGNNICFSVPGHADEDDNEKPEFLGEVAVHGRVVLFCEHDRFWGPGKDYVSEVLTDPTWLEVSLRASQMVEVTGDHHHVFLEGLDQADRRTVKACLRNHGKMIAAAGADVKIYEFLMGS